MSQLSLLTRRTYWPLFWTQFLGAFNDNVFKNAFVLLIAYRGITVLGMPPEQVVVLASGVFILPFLLLSPIAGQLCDKYSKTKLMQWVKVAEVGIMAIGAVGFAGPRTNCCCWCCSSWACIRHFSGQPSTASCRNWSTPTIWLQAMR